MKAIIRNFQSIKDQTLKIAGFTVLSGRSNLGKSAVIRAIEGALFGIPGDYFIRDGAKQCGVGLGFSDLKLKWLKVKTGAAAPGRETQLDLNDVKHTKLGRDHGTLTEPFGFKEIRTQYTRLRPQVASQMDPIFLIGENDSSVAEVFKLLGRVDVVTDAQKLARRDLLDTGKKLEIREADLITANTRLKEVQSVVESRVLFKAVSTLVADAFDAIAKRETARDLLKSLLLLPEKAIPSCRVFEPQDHKQRALNLLSRLPALRPNSPPIAPTFAEGGQAKSLALLNRLMQLEAKSIPTSPSLEGFRLDHPAISKLERFIFTRVEESGLMADQERVQIEANLCAISIKEMEAQMGVCPICSKPFTD